MAVNIYLPIPLLVHLTEQIWYILHFCLAVFIIIREGIDFLIIKNKIRKLKNNKSPFSDKLEMKR